MFSCVSGDPMIQSSHKINHHNCFLYEWCFRAPEEPTSQNQKTLIQRSPQCWCGQRGRARHCRATLPASQPIPVESGTNCSVSLNLPPCPGGASESLVLPCKSWMPPPANPLNPGCGRRHPAVCLSAKVPADSESHSGWRLLFASLVPLHYPGVLVPPGDTCRAWPSLSFFFLGLNLNSS